MNCLSVSPANRIALKLTLDSARMSDAAHRCLTSAWCISTNIICSRSSSTTARESWRRSTKASGYFVLTPSTATIDRMVASIRQKWILPCRLPCPFLRDREGGPGIVWTVHAAAPMKRSQPSKKAGNVWQSSDNPLILNEGNGRATLLNVFENKRLLPAEIAGSGNGYSKRHVALIR